MGNLGVNERLYEYDNRGRTVKEQVKIDSLTYDTLYTYDSADRVKTMTYPGSPAEPVTTVYNIQNLPQTLSGSGSYVTGASYNELSQPKQITFGNTASTTWTYYGEDGPPVPNNPSYRLWQMRTVKGSAELQKMQYVYDNVGNVLNIVDYKVLGGAQTQTFTYDHLDRLLTAVAAGGSAGQGQYGEAYTYNTIGNMTSKGGVTYNYDPDHKHAVITTTIGGTVNGSFSYDENGNMTSRKLTSAGPTYSQTWDYENRLASVTVNGQTTTFTYDGNGTLVKKLAGGQTTVYVGPHYEKNVSTGEVIKYYYFGGQRIATNKAGVVYWLLTDHLASTALTLNSGGSRVGELRYKAYGETRYTWGTTPTDYRFTGQRHTESLALYHMGARWYDPALGRWLSADTIVPDPANLQSLNRYSSHLSLCILTRR